MNDPKAMIRNKIPMNNVIDLYHRLDYPAVWIVETELRLALRFHFQLSKAKLKWPQHNFTIVEDY